MSRKIFTEDEIENEIERLRQSDCVALARKEQRIKNRRRQVLYQLRNLEKRGHELMEQGVTSENLEMFLQELDEED